MSEVPIGLIRVAGAGLPEAEMKRCEEVGPSLLDPVHLVY